MVLLTGGAGDLGQTVVLRLRAAGDPPVTLDVRAPAPDTPFIRGSVLDRAYLPDWLNGIDAIVHIAAWHRIHESRGEKEAYEFFDLNVTLGPCDFILHWNRTCTLATATGLRGPGRARCISTTLARR
jgi:nucleoside-diphosphate-sugar epimerase